MKLRNKKTGEIVKVNNLNAFVHLDEETKIYNSLADLNEEWEDYEEPKENYWYIDAEGEVYTYYSTRERTKELREIGNYFETEEEAKKAVEKLKAWKRLGDKGFRFKGWHGNTGEYSAVVVYADVDNLEEGTREDLDLLFGGEE